MMIQPVSKNINSEIPFKSIILPSPVLEKTLVTTISNLKYGDNSHKLRLGGKLFAQNLNTLLNDGKLRFLDFTEKSNGYASVNINSTIEEPGSSNWDYLVEHNQIKQRFHGEGTIGLIAALAEKLGKKHVRIEYDDPGFKQLDKDEIPYIKDEIDALHKINPETEQNFLLTLDTIYNRIASNLKEKVINDLEEIKKKIFLN